MAQIKQIEHYPVLYREVLQHVPAEARVFFDGTFGHGGHAQLLFESRNLEKYLGVDLDPQALKSAEEKMGFDRLILEHNRFDRALESLERKGLLSKGEIDFALVDLGTSQFQLREAARGFSFLKEGPLDMRMNNHSGMDLKSWLMEAEIEEISEVIRKYGEDKFHYRIAKAIHEKVEQLETTTDLANLIEATLPKSYLRNQKIHAATRSFQAFRIHLNGELECLQTFLAKIPYYMAKAGRLAVISFHSLEDRIAKECFKEWEREEYKISGMTTSGVVKASLGKRISRKVIKPGEEELKENNASRSAKMRVFEFKGGEA